MVYDCIIRIVAHLAVWKVVIHVLTKTAGRGGVSGADLTIAAEEAGGVLKDAPVAPQAPVHSSPRHVSQVVQLAAVA